MKLKNILKEYVTPWMLFIFICCLPFGIFITSEFQILLFVSFVLFNFFIIEDKYVTILGMILNLFVFCSLLFGNLLYFIFNYSNLSINILR